MIRRHFDRNEGIRQPYANFKTSHFVTYLSQADLLDRFSQESLLWQGFWSHFIRQAEMWGNIPMINFPKLHILLHILAPCSQIFWQRLLVTEIFRWDMIRNEGQDNPMLTSKLEHFVTISQLHFGRIFTRLE